jgi:hypothetical protein
MWFMTTRCSVSIISKLIGTVRNKYVRYLQTIPRNWRLLSRNERIQTFFPWKCTFISTKRHNAVVATSASYFGDFGFGSLISDRPSALEDKFWVSILRQVMYASFEILSCSWWLWSCHWGETTQTVGTKGPTVHRPGDIRVWWGTMVERYRQGKLLIRPLEPLRNPTIRV